MKKFLLALFLLSLLVVPKKALAYQDPLASPNNKFGIHLFNESDLGDAANLVNSNGGDWGYVIFVVTETERDKSRWQKAFDNMRRLHLIPIVRIASRQSKEGWEKLKVEEIDNWVSFLDSLNWVTQSRYVVIGNEPNHSAEWGGEVDPPGYASYLKEFSSQLKAKSSDYFVLPAALDASARNSSNTMDEAEFIKFMLKTNPNLFDYVDGWNSHSYPNPDFSGRETASGRGSIKTYDWELAYLSSLGIVKNFPVFITETGWSTMNLSEPEIGRRLSYAGNFVWNDKRIVTVTPFILNYPEQPFAHLSWRNKEGSFKSFYNAYQDIPKVKGEPVQIETGRIFAAFAQPISDITGDFGGIILAENTGQSIWTFNNISIGSLNGKPFIKNYSFNELEPEKIGLVVFKAEAPEKPGLYLSSLFLKGKNGNPITNSFLIESVMLDFKKVNLGSFFDKILGGVRFQGP